MDYVTLATQQLGGALAALLLGALVRRLSLGLAGSIVAGMVGGAVSGLVLTQYLDLPPVLLAGGYAGEPTAVLVQMAAGTVGGAALAIVTRVLTSLVRS